MKLKHISALFLALVMLFALASCGGKQDEKEVSSAHDFVYETLGGDKYSGTYKGDWEDGCPNGEGSFTGEGERGQLTLVGSWSDGQPNGQCRRVLTTGTYVKTYSGDMFFGEMRGTGSWKQEDLAGNLQITYSGEVRDNNFNGDGEMTYYYTVEQAAEYGYSRKTYSGGFQGGKYSGNGELAYYYTEEYAAEHGSSRKVTKGQFSNDTLNGEAELTIYYTEEYAASKGIDYAVYKGPYSNGKANGSMQAIYHYTEKYAAASGIDYEVLSGEFLDGSHLGNWRYTFYKDGKAIETGTIKNGKYVSDTEKSIKDALYDGLRDAAGDGILGDLFDIFGPAFYDRNGD